MPEDVTHVSCPFVGNELFEQLCAGAQRVRVYASDACEPLINFWQCLKKHARALCDEVDRLHPMTKERFDQLRQINELQRARENAHNRIRRAAAFFALNRCSFIDARPSRFSQAAAKRWFTSQSYAILPQWSNILRYVEFAHLDFGESLRLHPNALVLAIPPRHLRDEYCEEPPNREQLFESLEMRPYWIAVCSNSHAVRQLYSAFPMYDIRDQLVIVSPALAGHSDIARSIGSTGHKHAKSQGDPKLPLIVFDVNETLLNLQTMKLIFARIFGDKNMMQTVVRRPHLVFRSSDRGRRVCAIYRHWFSRDENAGRYAWHPDQQGR